MIPAFFLPPQPLPLVVLVHQREMPGSAEQDVTRERDGKTENDATEKEGLQERPVKCGQP